MLSAPNVCKSLERSAIILSMVGSWTNAFFADAPGKITGIYFDNTQDVQGYEHLLWTAEAFEGLLNLHFLNGLNLPLGWAFHCGNISISS